jgi:hypothetical protein
MHRHCVLAVNQSKPGKEWKSGVTKLRMTIEFLIMCMGFLFETYKTLIRAAAVTEIVYYRHPYDGNLRIIPLRNTRRGGGVCNWSRSVHIILHTAK